MMKLFPAYIHKSPRGAYGVSFADLAVMAGGDTYEQAVANAIDGLAAHVDAVIAEGLTVPEPSTAEAAWAEVKDDRDMTDGLEGVQMIPVDVADKTERVLITLPGSLLKRLDAASDNRSGFIAEAVREKLAHPTLGFEFRTSGHATEGNIKNLSSLRSGRASATAVAAGATRTTPSARLAPPGRRASKKR